VKSAYIFANCWLQHEKEGIPSSGLTSWQCGNKSYSSKRSAARNELMANDTNVYEYNCGPIETAKAVAVARPRQLPRLLHICGRMSWSGRALYNHRVVRLELSCIIPTFAWSGVIEDLRSGTHSHNHIEFQAQRLQTTSLCSTAIMSTAAARRSQVITTIDSTSMPHI
jgi:hypothetical protein